MQLTVRDVAAIFSVPESRVYRWIAEDFMPVLQLDGQHFFDRAELLEWATVRRLKFSPGILRFEGPWRPVETTTPPTPAKVSESPALVDALELGGVLHNIQGSTRAEVLTRMVETMALPEGTDRDMLLQLFVAREKRGSTAVGDGIAIPHPQHPVILPVPRPALTVCFLEKPVDFQAADGQPIHTLFTLICPTIRGHLRMLARVAIALRDDGFRAVINRRGSLEEILEQALRVEETFEPKQAVPEESA